MFPSIPVTVRDSEDVEKQGPTLKVMIILLSVLTATVIFLRICTRTFITHIFGLDDILAIIAFGLAISLSAVVYYANDQYYIGHHLQDVPDTAFEGAKHLLLTSEVMYTFSSCLTKISALLFFRRLSTRSTKVFLWAIHVGFILNVSFALVFLLWLYLMCQPPEAFWRQFNSTWLASHHDWKCHKDNIAVPVCAFISTSLDLYAALLPLLLIRNIQRSFKEKVILYSLFAFSYLVVVFGLIRAGLVWEALNGTPDLTWNLYECWLWTILELFSGIMATCIPTLRPLCVRIMGLCSGRNHPPSQSPIKPCDPEWWKHTVAACRVLQEHRTGMAMDKQCSQKALQPRESSSSRALSHSAEADCNSTDDQQQRMMNSHPLRPTISNMV